MELKTGNQNSELVANVNHSFAGLVANVTTLIT